MTSIMHSTKSHGITSEYDFAKQFIHNGDKVLEVGCGKGAFAKYIPQTQYLGLEFSTDAKKWLKKMV